MIYINEDKFEINMALITETEVQAVMNHQVDLAGISENNEDETKLQKSEDLTQN